MQFAGKPVHANNIRMYNCSFTTIESLRDISDILCLLCCGTGIGFSVQHRHISKLPIILEGHEEVFSVPDTKEGWAESVYHLFVNPKVTITYEQIRPRGAYLSSGGTASGPETLQVLHGKLRDILVGAANRQLRSIEVHDIICLMSDLVVCGGTRRSALISLFDLDDLEMMDSKNGFEWYSTHPHRARANNSAVLFRSDPDFLKKLEFVVRKCFVNGSGEPGLFVTNDPDYGTNPCAEISLRSKQMCNLTEVNASICRTKEEFFEAVSAAVVIGTLQVFFFF
jgi:ribonucleoside-diphosphate reductase alpha chain